MIILKRLVSSILTLYRKLFLKNNAIRRGAELYNVKLGSNINISRNSFVSNSTINDYSTIGRNSTIINAEIGKFCSISWNVTVGATKHDFTLLSTHAFTYVKHFGFSKTNKRIVKKTCIGNDVWIGANAIIMPGVCVGDGAVIGAGSIVTKDVKSYAVAFGAPAKVKQLRFNEELILELKDLKWWDWKKNKIKRNINMFKSQITIEDIRKIK